jgi:predicted MFS family arabinose efflux permease
MSVDTVSTTAAVPVESVAVRPAWAAVWALALTVATLNASEMLPASLLTPMAAGLATSEGVVGQSVTATALLAITTSLLVATLTRRFDRRNVLLVVAAAQVVSNLVVALAPNANVMLAGRLLLGLTVGGVWGLSASLALRLVPAPHVSRALSVIFGGSSVAVVAAAPIGALLGEMVGWRGVFVGAAGLAAAATVTLAVTLPRLPVQKTAMRSGLGATRRLPGLVAGMVGVMLLFAGQQQLATYLRPLLEVVGGLHSNGVALVLLGFGTASLLGTLAAPTFLRRSLRNTLTAAAGTQAVLLAVLFAVGQGSPILTMVLVAGWGFAVGMVAVGWSTWLAQTYPDHAESAGGLLVAVIQGSMMLGAMTGGVLIDTVGVTGPLLAATIVLAIGAVHTSIALRVRTS